MPDQKLSTATLRPARPDDSATIVALIRELAAYEKLEHEAVATADGLRGHLFADHPTAEVIIAEVAGEPVGFALYFNNFSTFRGCPGVYLEDLFVRTAYRGKGIGKALIAAVARVAVDQGAGRLDWAVLNWNTPAIDFYRSLGAQPMDGWIVNRVSDDALLRLAGLAPVVDNSTITTSEVGPS